jgi:quinol-cytochrome oxidoreductase complex cytochrome b subunit
MTIPEFISFLVSLLPFLNAGLVILIIDLILRCYDVEISKKEFTRHPIPSLLLGLGLIFISNLTYLLVQAWLSQMPPVAFFFFLMLIYFVIVFNMTSPSKRRRKHK